MAIIYPVIFTATHDKKDTYLVYIPDLDGITEGFGLSDSIKMARDYIGLAIYEMNDKDIPKASDKVKPTQSEFYKEYPKENSFVSYVDLDLDAYRRMMNQKAVRRNVSLSAWLDRRVTEENINCSRVLQEALIEKLNA